MITPKDRANKIFNDTLSIVNWITKEDAKEISLFIVDTIDKRIQESSEKDNPYEHLFAYEYWQEVKEELNKK